MTLTKKIVGVVSILIAVGLVIYVGLVVKIYSYINVDERQNSDVIVVMGASQWNGQPSPVFKARLDHAFLLYQEGLASKLILTGGVGSGEIKSESQVGKNYLLRKDVKEQDIIIEEIGHTSWQSLNQIVSIMKKEDLDSAIVVSDGFHIMRLKRMMKDLGIKSYFSSVADGPIGKLSELKYVLRDVRAYLLYLLFKI